MRSAGARRELLRPASKQIELLRRRARRPEMFGGEFGLVDVEAEPGAGGLEALADHPGIGAAAGHALAERGVVVLAAAGLSDQREYVPLAVGEVRLQPFAEVVA